MSSGWRWCSTPQANEPGMLLRIGGRSGGSAIEVSITGRSVPTGRRSGTCILSAPWSLAFARWVADRDRNEAYSAAALAYYAGGKAPGSAHPDAITASRSSMVSPASPREPSVSGRSSTAAVYPTRQTTQDPPEQIRTRRSAGHGAALASAGFEQNPRAQRRLLDACRHAAARHLWVRLRPSLPWQEVRPFLATASLALPPSKGGRSGWSRCRHERRHARGRLRGRQPPGAASRLWASDLRLPVRYPAISPSRRGQHAPPASAPLVGGPGHLRCYRASPPSATRRGRLPNAKLGSRSERRSSAVRVRRAPSPNN